MADPPLGAQGTPEPIIRLQRTWGVWQIPELEGPDAEALLEQWPPGVSTGRALLPGHPLLVAMRNTITWPAPKGWIKELKPLKCNFNQV